jgi:predicted nucleic acid-binding protein
MNDKIFLDSNVIIYAHTDLDLGKQQVAQHIITTENTTISTQVLQEIANILHKKFQFDWTNIQTVLKEAALNNSLHTNVASTIADACVSLSVMDFLFMIV